MQVSYRYLKEEETYEDGIKNGISKKYYPNGLLKEIAEYKEGKLNGDFSQFILMVILKNIFFLKMIK